MSLPAWECGLKQSGQCKRKNVSRVTPRVGVWIETSIKDDDKSLLSVTPRVGVWIETCSEARVQKHTWSLPAWECGLKLLRDVQENSLVSHSPRGSVD